MKYLILLTVLAFILSCSKTATKNDHDTIADSDNETLTDETIDSDDSDEISDTNDGPDDDSSDPDELTDDDTFMDNDLQSDDVPDTDTDTDEFDEDVQPDEDGGYEIIAVDNDPSPLSTSSLSYNGMNAAVTLNDTEYRTYELSTDITLRDNNPASKSVVIVEENGQMVLRSGNNIFDALFALAMQEVKEDSVEEISDGGFNNGNPVPCSCFETGEKWNYVWTRDTAYSVELALALVDPVRSMNSLLFKISDRKDSIGGGSPEIVQDTGSGGSWPISSDRVSWAFAAYELLNYLNTADRESFFELAYEAITNTVETDRIAVFDPRDGLYFGEQSFLDWREQTYPSWTKENTVHIGMSKSLSTNILHLNALTVLSKMADEAGDTTAVTKYSQWAQDLETAIKNGFLIDGDPLLSTFKTTELDSFAVNKHDLLGQSLSVLTSDIFQTESPDFVSNYPRTPHGAPVIWPQNPFTPIYHNRAIWPFVTAYDLRAAYKVKNSSAMENGIKSLMYGAAFNLSNMENFEFTALSNSYEDGIYSGPVVNSRRQLWSVSGYLSMVIKVLAGFDVKDGVLSFSPVIPVSFRNDVLKETEKLVLRNIPFHGKLLHIHIILPPSDEATSGYFTVKSILHNGKPLTGGLSASDLVSENDIVIDMTTKVVDSSEIKLIDNYTAPYIYAPKEPVTPVISVNSGNISFDLNKNGETAATSFSVFRNGSRVATGLNAGTWTDPDSADCQAETCCYSISQTFTATGNESHHTDPQCYWGNAFERITTYSASSMVTTGGGELVNEHGKLHLSDWGTPAQAVVVDNITVSQSGKYYIQLEYSNGRPINTGITCAVKKIEVFEKGTDALVSTGIVKMPHIISWDRWDNSSFAQTELDSSKSYRITISDFNNMSYFDHFTIYTAGTGGGAEVYNRINLSALKLLRME